jgi:hypothetical protein
MKREDQLKRNKQKAEKQWKYLKTNEERMLE